MKLYVDPTLPDRIVFGIRKNRRAIVASTDFSSGHHEMVLAKLSAFLKRRKIRLGDLTELVIVNGPGKYSSLRVAVTIANILGWQQKCALFSVRHSDIPPEQAESYLRDLDARLRPTKALRPYYGRPPSITMPKKKR